MNHAIDNDDHESSLQRGEDLSSTDFIAQPTLSPQRPTTSAEGGNIDVQDTHQNFPIMPDE